MSRLRTLVSRLPYHSIRSRMLLIALLPALFTEFGLVAYFTTQSLDTAERALLARADNAANHLGDALTYALVSGDTSLAQSLLAAEVRNSQLAHARVVDRSGSVFAGQGQRPAGNHVVRRMSVSLPRTELAEDALYASAGPAIPSVLGQVEVSVTRDAVESFTRGALLRAAMLMLAALTLTGMVAWHLSGRLASQLNHVSRVVARLARDDLSVRTHLPVRGEVGQLAAGVNLMANALQAQRSQMEARIQAATADLAAKKDMAERANMAKSRFFAAASHDLRQPLHALSLFVATLKARNRQSETQPLIDNIEASTAAMELLFNALLDISRLDAGAIEPHPVHFSLDRLFADLDKQFSALATDKQLSLRFRGSAPALYSDPLLLERILVNLIANAIRYTDDGGVLVTCRRRGCTVRLAVYDTGRGIPVDQQESVFQEFVQLHNAARDRSKGLGLGLAIVSRLGRLLGHRVLLRSRPGHGSVFSIDVPLGDPTLIQAASPPASPGKMPADALVLLIDDESAILRGMAELFDNWNIDLVTAHSAGEAEQWLASIERIPDVIVSDYRLPDDDGLAVIARLRTHFGHNIPAILVTGDTAPETLQRITKAGLPLLHKPLRPAKLRALLTHLIQQSRADAVG
ncbi:MAG: hybrid sensor histidine kinase/response regulator [Hydrogenophilales bacterium 16-64-46]|nr:MAG: hybrid sensor histidine kinase/response regulator [Hydrogenophilales bacterium 12-64-13]OYZ05289.1 MAG: hybrid sensor histidine kinase/response regulator [Hydrogenophilales bacterium 16-64-46]OZA37103.1 MAG: hybrid sensor histidine kinase/response regulator [Hydrogenophilales bacterium 17-64-34]HQS99415.1 ATP-binding protein [Thiobacillus sp.]